MTKETETLSVCKTKKSLCERDGRYAEQKTYTFTFLFLGQAW